MNRPIMDATYSIQQVADITGISKQVIRKWEERHQIVVPQRLDNGYRVYSDHNIKALLSVKALVEQGHSIKKASMLVQNMGSAVDINMNDQRKPIQVYAEMNDYVLELLHEGAHCNEIGMNLILQQALHQIGLDEFLHKVVTPFLKEVGQKWEIGDWDELQESLASLAVRDFLVQIRRNFKTKDDSPLMLGACLPHEHHEVPIHILLLHVMLKGWNTVLLGASPAPGSIPSIVERLNPKKVLLSAMTTIPFEKDPDLLLHLEKLAAEHANISFHLGGPGAIEYTTGMTLHSIKVTNSIEMVLRG